jgi:ABC-type lipoprotein release transport system permease subunit
MGPRQPARFPQLALLGGAAVAACLIPAWKAEQVDPIQALNVQ